MHKQNKDNQDVTKCIHINVRKVVVSIGNNGMETVGTVLHRKIIKISQENMPNANI